MLRRIEERIDLGDGHALGAVKELLDAIASADLTFLDDAEIEAGPAVRNQQRWHLRMLQPDADPVAGVAWLADLDDGAADPEAIADADLVIGEAVHCEVLAEVPGYEIRPAKIARPVPVGFELVYQERTLLAAMARGGPPWPSPSRFSRPAKIRPVTGVFQTAVRTVLPCHATS